MEAIEVYAVGHVSDARRLQALGRDTEAAALRQKFDLPPSTTQPTTRRANQPVRPAYSVPNKSKKNDRAT